MKPLMRVLQASPRGFCAGVVRAIETLEAALERYGAPIYARHAIVHNSVVVKSFERRGVVFVEELDEVPDEAVVIFSAHGVPRQVAASAFQRGLCVIDATCPLVSKVQSEVKHHVAAGRVVLLIGHVNHPEVLGIAGQVPKSKVYVIPDLETALTLPLDPDGEYGLAMQTTLSISDTAVIEGVLRERLLNVHAPAKDDICYATTNRQHAVRVLAPRCEAFVVLGGHSSSNSHRLVETAEAAGCARVLLVERPDELGLSWLAGIRVLGVSSGASTPETLMDELIMRLEEVFDVNVVEVGAATEGVRFGLPSLPLRASVNVLGSPAKAR